MDRMIDEGRLRIICKKCGEPHYKGDWKKCPKCGCEEATPQYLVNETDQIILDTNWTDIAGYSSKTGFSTENAEVLLDRALEVCSSEGELVCDYFAGSGTRNNVLRLSPNAKIAIDKVLDVTYAGSGNPLDEASYPWTLVTNKECDQVFSALSDNFTSIQALYNKVHELQIEIDTLKNENTVLKQDVNALKNKINN
jgi:hypothetical protein